MIMKATIKLVNVYSAILEETKKDILVEANGNKYLGGLLNSENDWVDEEIKETLYVEEIEGTIEEIIEAIVKIRNENDIKVYKDTKRTMAWWGYLNGLFETHITLS